MKKYYVRYEDKSGDTTTIWLMADSEYDARSQAKQEYWDIERIISVCAA